MLGSTWHHKRVCVKVKLSHDGPVAIRCKELNLENFAPRVKWLNQNILG